MTHGEVPPNADRGKRTGAGAGRRTRWWWVSARRSGTYLRGTTALGCSGADGRGGSGGCGVAAGLLAAPPATASVTLGVGAVSVHGAVVADGGTGRGLGSVTPCCSSQSSAAFDRPSELEQELSSAPVMDTNRSGARSRRGQDMQPLCTVLPSMSGAPSVESPDQVIKRSGGVRRVTDPAALGPVGRAPPTSGAGNGKIESGRPGRPHLLGMPDNRGARRDGGEWLFLMLARQVGSSCLPSTKLRVIRSGTMTSLDRPTPVRAPLLLADVEAAVRSSWGADTCPSEGRPRWSPSNPARGQCGVTAMVLNDLLGGELIRGEVRVDGEFTDYHWWNRVGMGIEIDLTREQFSSEEIVTGGVAVSRKPVNSWRRLREEYEILRSRVEEHLGAQPGSSSPC